MALNQSTIGWFDAPSCKVTPKGHPSADRLLHLNYSMQNNSFADVLRLGALWLVADFEALSYQVKLNFNKSENLETGTATAINYSAC
jgi:hypothetical protein